MKPDEAIQVLRDLLPLYLHGSPHHRAIAAAIERFTVPTFDELVDAVCGQMPEGYAVRLEIDDSASVSAEDDYYEDIDLDADEGSVSERLLRALATCKEHAKEAGRED